MNQSIDQSATTSHASRRRWRLMIVVVALVALAFPWILAKTSLRNRLLQKIVNSDDLTVVSQDASFGYLSSLWLAGLRVESKDDSARIEVDRIESEHSWLGLLFSRPDLGTFRFERPTIDVRVKAKTERDNEPAAPQDHAPPVDFPLLTAELRDASVIIRSSKSGDPPIDVNGINLTVRVTRDQDQSVLQIDPSTVFDHQQLTPERCGHGLQLIAPLLADAVKADGEFSLRLDEFQVPLKKSGDGSGIRIAGQLDLHRASVDLNNTLTTLIAGIAIKLVGRELPQTISVAEEVKVQFQMIDGRFHHQGLAFLLPHKDSSIEISSSGSVGLDETLDLEVSIQLPDGMLGQSAISSRLTGRPITFAIAGTLDQPKLGLPTNADWLGTIQQIISNNADDAQAQSLQQSVSEILGGLLDRGIDREVPIRTEPLLPGLRQRLQDLPGRKRRLRIDEPESI